MLKLESITMLSINCIDAEVTVKALNHSSRKISFGAVKLMSSVRPANITPDIEWIKIAPLDLDGYSVFVLNELWKYVSTPHCLIIQNDGYVLNPHLWRPEFLDYDYVGAPWPELHNSDRVGNGGFSLRSKKLLDLTRDMPCTMAEDLMICSVMRKHLEERGIKFAPVHVASKFSLELPIKGLHNKLSHTFGFHGKWHAAKLDLL